jgi:hypothetical protein
VQGVRFATGIVVDHEYSDGGIVLSDAPGSGITVDVEAIAVAASTADWSDPAGPHVRPERAGLRLLLDGVER